MKYDKKTDINLQKIPKWVAVAVDSLPICDHPTWNRRDPLKITVHVYFQNHESIQRLLDWATSFNIEFRIEGTTYAQEDTEEPIAIEYRFNKSHTNYFAKKGVE